jgi:peroxin-6
LTDSERLLFLAEHFKLDSNMLSKNFKDNFLKKTNGLFYGEMQTLCDLINLSTTTSDTKILEENFTTLFEKFSKNRKFQQENKLNIDVINWNDVGGLNDIKEIITDTIVLPLTYPFLFSSSNNRIGITRSGILLYGPPGTGKTLLAKAIANECGLNFLSVKGPELLDMYVGQTEFNVRNLFEKARLNSPCILFFDELDSLAPIRGRAGDSGGVMDRVVSQLLTEIDGLDKYNTIVSQKITQIFLIGATNRPDLIDPSLLRPGRFDKLIYVPIAKSNSERVNILSALCRKLPLDPQFSIENFVEKCLTNLSGADFYALTNRARQHALKRLINHFESNQNSCLNDENIIVLTQQDFDYALIDFQPTLSEATLLDYEKYFNNYSNKN